MAGMFSLLHKSQLRLEMAAGSAAIDDNNSDFRKKSSIHRSPLPGRRILRQVQMKTGGCNSDRVPKRFRKRRCNEIHPLLRRSICTLLLAGSGIATGLVLVLVDYYAVRTISKPGIIVLAVSGFVFLVGIAWFWWSSVQLCKYRKKLTALHAENEAQMEEASSGEQLHIHQRICDPAALSASKWPTRRVLPDQLAEQSNTTSTQFTEIHAVDEKASHKNGVACDTSAKKIQTLNLRQGSIPSMDGEDSGFYNAPLNGRRIRTGWCSSTVMAKEAPRIYVSKCERF